MEIVIFTLMGFVKTLKIEFKYLRRIFSCVWNAIETKKKKNIYNYFLSTRVKITYCIDVPKRYLVLV